MDDQLRIDFEFYIKDKFAFADLSRSGDGYASYHVNSMWQAWWASYYFYDNK